MKDKLTFEQECQLIANGEDLPKEKQIEIKHGHENMVDLLNQEQEELQKAKAIEEMAKDLKEIETDVGHTLLNETFSYVKEHKKYNPKNDFSKAHTKTFEELTAEEMIKRGWVKHNEDSVVITREEYELLTNDLDKHDYGEFESGYSQGSKETAEKILNKLKIKFRRQEERFATDVTRFETDLDKVRESDLPTAKYLIGKATGQATMAEKAQYYIDEIAKQFGVEIGGKE